MQYIHPAALVGILLNGGIVLLFNLAVAHTDKTSLTADQIALLEQMARLYPFFIFVILVQIVSLLLLQKKSLFGIVGATLGALMMLPIGAVYGIGCLLTYYTVRYQEFATSSEPLSKARQVFRSSYATPLFIGGGAFAASTWLFFSMMVMDLALVSLTSSLVCMFLSARAQKMPPLAFYDDCLVVVPKVFSRRLMIPYAELRSATLFQDSLIEFLLEKDRKLFRLDWSLKSVMKTEQKNALEVMARTLRDHHVALR